MTTLLHTYTVRSLRRRGLLRGAVSAFDLRGATARRFRHGSDADAIRDDFATIGTDLAAAIRRYDEGPTASEGGDR